MITKLLHSKPFYSAVFKVVIILLRTAGADIDEFCRVAQEKENDQAK